jgi:hypothetical protein
MSAVPPLMGLVRPRVDRRFIEDSVRNKFKCVVFLPAGQE